MTRVVPRRHLLNSVLLAAALLNLIPLTNSAEAVSPRRGWGRGGKRTPLAYSVCVTGAAGFLGSEIVHQLLASGHQVCAAVRNPADAAHLGNFQGVLPPGASLKVVGGCDILRPGACSAAMQGCEVVMHVAAPFPARLASAEEAIQVARTCVEGTRNVVQSARAAGARRLVLTSSMAAVRGPRCSPSRGIAFDPRCDWNRSSRPDGPGMEPYQWAKTRAEEEALEASDPQGMSVVSILPTFLLGPPRTFQREGTSVGLMRGWLRGEGKVQSRLICDVRDAARAHLAAADIDASLAAAFGNRFLVGGEQRVPARSLREALWEASCDASEESGVASSDIAAADDWAPPGGWGAGGKEVEARAGLDVLLGPGVILRSGEESARDMARVLLLHGGGGGALVSEFPPLE